jgi:hypothetical protein
LTINKRERERDREREKRERHMREREKEEREKRRERGYLLGTILHSDARRMTEGKERERERETFIDNQRTGLETADQQTIHT